MSSALRPHVFSRFKSTTAFAVLGLVLSLTSGCGGSSSTEEKATVGGITGQVTFQGKPVTEGEVVFTNTQINTEVPGSLNAEGKYTVTGVVVGESLVSVRPVLPPPTMDVNAPKSKPADPANIPKKYRNAKTSGLKLQVGKGAVKFNVELKP